MTSLFDFAKSKVIHEIRNIKSLIKMLLVSQLSTSLERETVVGLLGSIYPEKGKPIRLKFNC